LKESSCHDLNFGSMTGIYARFPSKVPRLCEPKLTY
jgi:hypothetical protein